VTVFCFVRHGAYALLDQALGGRGDYALNDEGRAQAVRAARALAERPVAAVVSSPVARAMETAAPIGAALGLPVMQDAAFSEIDFGVWSGTRFDTLAGDPAWRAWNLFRGTARVPGGESALDVQARAVGAVGRLAAAWSEGEVVVVSHADVIKAVLGHVLGAPLDLMRRIEIAPGSISRVAVWREDARVLGMNWTAG
jgi:probable phosphoglycerate mutase